MTSTEPRHLTNKLQIYRKRKALRLKQVASLLGRKNTAQLSRYEAGSAVPSLKTALKLAIIYNIPIQVLLEGYFEACREEVRREPAVLQGQTPQVEFCTIEEKLAATSPSQSTLDKASRHATNLIRERSEKLDHISERR
jgi:transcriptional regulator with XRE-family HTH domain